MNILNATVQDSYHDNGQPTGVKQSTVLPVPAVNIFATAWAGVAGNFNTSDSFFGSATSPGPDGFNFTITPNQGYSTAAEAYKWNKDNPEAVASDGKLAKKLIDDVLFFDSEEPWSENNIVKVVVKWKDDFVYPGPTVDNPNGYPVYKVMIDIMDNPGAQLFGVRFVNLCLVNDFADAVWCWKEGEPSPSHIDDMSDNYLYQQGWTDAFKTKRPLKYRGEVESYLYNPLNIEGVTFEPAVDPTGQLAYYFDTRDLHLGTNNEHIPSEEAYGVNASDLSGAEGFQIQSRKDVIYVGTHVRDGEATKIGRITLKLNQDLYIPKTKENEAFINTISTDQFREGFIANLGRVNGWAGKWSFAQATPERMMTWSGLGTGNSIIGRGNVDNPHGNIPISRVDPSSTDVNDIDDFLHAAGTNENMGDWATFYQTDQSHRPSMPEFLPPSGTKMRNFMTQNDEIKPNLYDGSTDTFGSQPGEFGDTAFGNFLYTQTNTSMGIFNANMDQDTQLQNNYLLSQGVYDSGGSFYMDQDVNQYITDTYNLEGTAVHSEDLFKVYESISFWTDTLYTHLDLHPWAFFPTFSVGGNGCYSNDSNPENGSEAINAITATSGKFVGQSKFALGGFELKSWAPSRWVQNALLKDPNHSLPYFSNNHGIPGGNLDPMHGTPVNSSTVDYYFTNTINALSETTSALSNYYREVSFDVFYVDNKDHVQFEMQANPSFGFQPDGTVGTSMTTENNEGPTLFENFTAGLSCNLKWDYLPWRKIIDIAGGIQEFEGFGRSGRSFKNYNRNFTNVPKGISSERDRYEIREVNLNLGSQSGVYGHIINPGGIGPESDATVEVVGDPGAIFGVKFRKVKTVETAAGDGNDGGSNPRSAGSEDILNEFLDGGLIPIVDLDDPDNNIFKITSKTGLKVIKLPNVRPLDIASGWTEYEIIVETSPSKPEEVIDDPSPTIDPIYICERDYAAWIAAQDCIPPQPVTIKPGESGYLNSCSGQHTLLVYPCGYIADTGSSSSDINPAQRDGSGYKSKKYNKPTVLSGKAKKRGYRLISPDSTRSKIIIPLRQYPYVDIAYEAENIAGCTYDNSGDGYNISDIPKFANIGGKKLGKPFGIVNEISFLRDNQKNIDFEIRIHKSGGAFKLKKILPLACVGAKDCTVELRSCSYNNSTTISHEENFSIKKGMYVEGRGIPSGAYVVSVTNTTSFVINASTTGGSTTNVRVDVVRDELDPSIFRPKVSRNGEKVEIYNLKAHIGQGLNTTNAEYATLLGKIRYVNLGQQSQTFAVDFNDIFELA